MSEIVEGKGFDFNLTSLQKKVVAITVLISGWGIWALYSTPNTLEVCKSFMGDTNISIFGISGIVIGIVAGLAFSVGELLFIFLYIWKKKFAFLIGLAVCAYISILGTFKAFDIGHETANIKQKQVDNAQLLVLDIEKQIKLEKDYATSLKNQIERHILEDGKVPGWKNLRFRKTNERIAILTKELRAARNNETNTMQNIGAIVKIDSVMNKKASRIIGALLELMLIAFTFVGIGLYNSASDYVNTLSSSVNKLSSSVNKKNPPCQVTAAGRQPKLSMVGDSDAIYATYCQWQRQGVNLNDKTRKPNLTTLSRKFNVSRQHVSQVVKANEKKTFGFGD